MTFTEVTFTMADFAPKPTERDATGAPKREADKRTFGSYEPTGFSYRTWEDRPTLLQALFGGHNWVRVSRERWGRKCYETWNEPDGVIGRWYWVPDERYKPSGSPPLSPVCARDSLEDEMGYEAATRYIGSRECAIGTPIDSPKP